MELVRVDERLPDAPLDSEVVLHVRRHLRAGIRRREDGASRDLAHLFGFPRDDGSEEEWVVAANSGEPLQAGARVAARRRGDRGAVVMLGHDAAHVFECKRWLAARKALDATFDAIRASDMATLLQLSKARDVACARGASRGGGERFLPVLIQGATGTGKEVLAQAIHTLWSTTLGRRKAPFEVVQVGGMSEDMVNDELFGHARGAFTGANRDRPGRLEAAHTGTLLIDEVGDLPPSAQVRLLRFLQNQVVSRIGENAERQLEVRVIAATWHDLDADVAVHRFREDLLHRLRVGSGLLLPALADRESVFDDVLPELLKDRDHVAQPPVTRSARDALAIHGWPGNLRELVGVLDEAVALANGETIRVEHLPAHLQRRYVQLPLYERALGFLLDEVDGQGLPQEHVSWRIEQINLSLAAVSLPPQNEELTSLGQFLSLLDDSSDEHSRAVAEVQRLLELDQLHRRATLVAGFWSNVLIVQPPPAVARLVRDAVAEAERVRQTIGREIEAVQKSSAIDSDPWLRLFREIQGLPLLRQAPMGELAKAFVATFNILKLVAPPIVEQVRVDAAEGGFARIRERVTEALKATNGQQPPPTEEEVEVPPPAKLSRAEWRELGERFSTQRAAVKATGYDPKTIAKYFRQYRIRNPWRSGT